MELRKRFRLTPSSSPGGQIRPSKRCHSSLLEASSGDGGEVSEPSIVLVVPSRRGAFPPPAQPAYHRSFAKPDSSDSSQSQSQSQPRQSPFRPTYTDASSKGVVRGQWDHEEDEVLRMRVEKFGPRNWKFIATFIPGRNGKQCRERWNNHLRPEVSKRPWTTQEDSKLLSCHDALGNKWSKIAKALPGRSENSIKNRYNSLAVHRNSHFAASLEKCRPPPLTIDASSHRSQLPLSTPNRVLSALNRAVPDCPCIPSPGGAPLLLLKNSRSHWDRLAAFDMKSVATKLYQNEIRRSALLGDVCLTESEWERHRMDQSAAFAPLSGRRPPPLDAASSPDSSDLFAFPGGPLIFSGASSVLGGPPQRLSRQTPNFESTPPAWSTCRLWEQSSPGNPPFPSPASCFFSPNSFSNTSRMDSFSRREHPFDSPFGGSGLGGSRSFIPLPQPSPSGVALSPMPSMSPASFACDGGSPGRVPTPNGSHPPSPRAAPSPNWLEIVPPSSSAAPMSSMANELSSIWGLHQRGEISDDARGSLVRSFVTSVTPSAGTPQHF